MSLKVKLALLLSSVVFVLLLASFTTVYLFYSEFRQEEFYQRLHDKCLTTYKLLIEVEEMDHEVIKVINKNTLYALYDEKVMIFDDNNQILYSSIDDKKITYSLSLLREIRKEGEIRAKEGESEVYGALIREPEHNYVVLASAYDKYGKEKLNNLRVTMTVTFVTCILLTCIFSVLYARSIVDPLDHLNVQVQRINENNMREKVTVGKSNDEISSLAKNYNLMLDRIDNAFAVQKSFVQHASHELRTPIAAMIAQTESALDKELSIEEYKSLLTSLLEDQRDLADLSNALLLLSRYEQVQFNEKWPVVRLDEVIYKSIDMVQALYSGYSIHFDFMRIPEDENSLKINGQEMLLQSAFRNLIKNACHYSDDKTIQISMNFSSQEITVEITNRGATLASDEIGHLFTPFFRGQNSMQKKGFGLGLSICQRIFAIHNGKITYVIPAPGTNRMTIILPRKF